MRAVAGRWRGDGQQLVDDLEMAVLFSTAFIGSLKREFGTFAPSRRRPTTRGRRRSARMLKDGISPEDILMRLPPKGKEYVQLALAAGRDDGGCIMRGRIVPPSGFQEQGSMGRPTIQDGLELPGEFAGIYAPAIDLQKTSTWKTVWEKDDPPLRRWSHVRERGHPSLPQGAVSMWAEVRIYSGITGFRDLVKVAAVNSFSGALVFDLEGYKTSFVSISVDARQIVGRAAVGRGGERLQDVDRREAVPMNQSQLQRERIIVLDVTNAAPHAAGCGQRRVDSQIIMVRSRRPAGRPCPRASCSSSRADPRRPHLRRDTRPSCGSAARPRGDGPTS